MPSPLTTSRYPSFPPGGQTIEPALLPDGPALDVQFKPRFSIYLAGGQLAEFIVRANPSPWRGQKWPNLNKASSSPPPPLFFNISLVSDKRVLVSDRLDISSSSSTSSTPSRNVFAFDLSQYGLTPRFEPYQVVLTGADPSDTYHISATSELVFLPDKKTGSITRLDHLNGGILFRSAATDHIFEPFLPFGYYASCDRFLCDKDYVAKVKAYQALGMNSMVSLTTVQDSGPAYKLMDGLDMRYMYDLREWYKNLTAVREQVSVIRDFEGLYSYWGADEYVFLRPAHPAKILLPSFRSFEVVEMANKHANQLLGQMGIKIPSIFFPKPATPSANSTPTIPSP